MTVTNPWAIWLFAAVVPLIAAFLIRRYRRRLVVPSVVIYRQVAAQSTITRRFAIPQHLVALLLSVLALGALGTAVLEPRPNDVEPRNYVVIVDASSSMSTTELGEEESRFERAVASLRGFVDELNPFDRLALIEMGAEARLALGWTTDHAQAIDALSDVAPLGAAHGVLDAFQIADAMCQNPQDTEIIVVSDGAGLGVPELRCPLRYVRVGEEASNMAITGLTVREADALGLNEIYLAVHNSADYTRDIDVELRLDEFLVDVVSLEVGPRATVEQLIRLPLPPGEALVAQLSGEGENALSEDDQAFAVMRPGARVQALLITAFPTTFMAEALRLHPRVDLTVVRPDAVDPDSGPFDLIVVDSDTEGELPASAKLLVLNADADRFSLNTTGVVREPPIIRWEFDHPLFRFVNLDGVRVLGATAIALPDDATSLADMPDGPLIFTTSYDGRELVYFGFHPDRSDLPLRVAFVNLVANIVEWAQPFDSLRVSTNVELGQRLASAGSDWTLVPAVTGPGAGVDGSLALQASDPVPHPGVYHLETGAGVTRGLVAANLFSATEADLHPVVRLGAGAASGWPEVFAVEAFPWWILALVAIALLILEWVLPGLIGLLYRRGNRRGRQAGGAAHRARGLTNISPSAPPPQPASVQSR